MQYIYIYIYFLIKDTGQSALLKDEKIVAFSTNCNYNIEISEIKYNDIRLTIIVHRDHYEI